jgi:hypothetical protein
MRIRNCLIITASESDIELRPDELREFSGNLVVNEAFLGNWAEIIREWRGVSTALGDENSLGPQPGRASMHEEVLG